jgi:hypothetical protein
LVLVCLFAIGCGSKSAADTESAQELVRSLNHNTEFVLVEGPEYVNIPKIPKHGPGDRRPDRGAVCGVRIRFISRDEGRTTRDDWVVWVTGEHKAIDWASNGEGDNWRQYVRSLAKR